MQRMVLQALTQEVFSLVISTMKAIITIESLYLAEGADYWLQNT